MEESLDKRVRERYIKPFISVRKENKWIFFDEENCFPIFEFELKIVQNGFQFYPELFEFCYLDKLKGE